MLRYYLQINNLEPGPGTWNLEPGAWSLEPPVQFLGSRYLITLTTLTTHTYTYIDANRSVVTSHLIG